MSIIPLVVVGALLLGSGGGGSGGKKKQLDLKPAEQAPTPEDEEAVLCEVDVGDFVLDADLSPAELALLWMHYAGTDYGDFDGTQHFLEKRFIPGKMGQWAADNVSVARTWAQAAMFTAYELMEKGAESPWPLCWGGGKEPPPSWTRAEWAAVMVCKLTVTRVIGYAGPAASLYADARAAQQQTVSKKLSATFVAEGLNALSPEEWRAPENLRFGATHRLVADGEKTGEFGVFRPKFDIYALPRIRSWLFFNIVRFLKESLV